MRLLHIFMTCLVVAAAIFGVVKRQTYTDITVKEDYLETMDVAEIPEALAQSNCEELREVLPGAPIILRVEAAEGIEHIFNGGRQKVRVLEIFRGEGLETGEEIYLSFHSWGVIVREDLASVQCGFVNVMGVGKEYLVFVSEKYNGLEEETPTYLLDVSDCPVAPVFGYDEYQNVIVAPGGTSTYVPYKAVKENEFFAASEEALAELEALKEEMLALFPAGGRGGVRHHPEEGSAVCPFYVLKEEEKSGIVYSRL